MLSWLSAIKWEKEAGGAEAALQHGLQHGTAAAWVSSRLRCSPPAAACCTWCPPAAGCRPAMQRQTPGGMVGAGHMGRQGKVEAQWQGDAPAVGVARDSTVTGIAHWSCADTCGKLAACDRAAQARGSGRRHRKAAGGWVGAHLVHLPLCTVQRARQLGRHLLLVQQGRHAAQVGRAGCPLQRPARGREGRSLRRRRRREQAHWRRQSTQGGGVGPGAAVLHLQHCHLTDWMRRRPAAACLAARVLP